MVSKQGFSLIELTLALSISSVVALGLFYVVGHQLRGYKGQRAVTQIQDSLRVAMEFIKRDLSMAGYGIGKEDALHFYDASTRIHGVSLQPSKPTKGSYFFNNLLVSRAFGSSFSITQYSGPSTLAGSGTLQLCDNVKSSFSGTGLYANYAYASLVDQYSRDYAVIEIPVNNIRTVTCANTTACGTATCTSISFKVVDPQNATRGAGVWLGSSSWKTDFTSGSLFGDFRTVAYYVSSSSSATWNDPDQGSILWRNDGVSPASALLEGVEGLQVDFEHLDSNSVITSCSTGTATSTSYAQVHLTGKRGCGLKSRHAFVSLVAKSARADQILPSYPMITISSEIQNGTSQCYPYALMVGPSSCSASSDGYRRRALTSHVYVRNLAWRDRE